MPYYILDTTDNNTTIASLRSAMEQAGLVQEIVYHVGNVLIVRTNRFPKLLHLHAGGGPADCRPWLGYVTSHTGGGNVTEYVQLFGVTSGFWKFWALVVNQDAFAILAKSENLQRYGVAYFSSLSSVPGVPVAGGCGNEGYRGGLRRMSDNASLLVAGLSYGGYTIMNSEGTRYMQHSPVIVSQSGTLIDAGGLRGIYALCRSASYVPGLEVYGSSVVLCGGTVSVPVDGWPHPVLIMPNVVTQ